MVIKSWHDEDTEAIFYGKKPRKLPQQAGFLRTAHRRLVQLDAATDLKDMRIPGGNRLHPLEKERAGQWAVWINSQYRLVWEWHDADAYNVEITDYHS